MTFWTDWEPTDQDAIFLRDQAHKDSSTASITNLYLSTPELGPNPVAVPLPGGGAGPAGVQASGPNIAATPTKNSLQIAGVDLNAGFTLTGTFTPTWGSPVPHQLQPGLPDQGG